MGKVSKIEWTDASWNPWLGCTKVSPGCKNCYAERIEKRYGRDFDVVRRTSPHTFDSPLRWEEPLTIFTASMSDFFHEDADPWRAEAWDIIRRTPRHTYQVLTKRPERIMEALPEDWGTGWENVWLGVSVESQPFMKRVFELIKTPAVIHFVSAEPLLGPLNFGVSSLTLGSLLSALGSLLNGLDWVITGGESDPHHPRSSDPEWFRSIQHQCLHADVAFFHKQNGGSSKCECHDAWGCRLLDGRTWDEMPERTVEA